MNHSLTLLTDKIPGFNKRVQLEADFWKLIKRERIIFVTWKMGQGCKAFYGVNNKGKKIYRFIVMDEDLFTTGQWLRRRVSRADPSFPACYRQPAKSVLVERRRARPSRSPG
jgi:hypothetical protein